ncbi:hypothetical protein EUX98_g4283 [Antrodiella citrinella]|uniref:Uncharacterized protein n=1 Tax=Antrodiella citrinella TaxID=2447956 RepID=A0A4V3XIN6_9APHY|nr:hypothetical protein EUX98_g4283 [Antrodiella citrinella]
MSSIINKVKEKTSSRKSDSASAQSQQQPQRNEEPTYSIQPHPAKSEDPRDLEPSQLGGGLNSNPEYGALHARDPHVPSKDVLNNINEAPAYTSMSQSQTQSQSNPQQPPAQARADSQSNASASQNGGASTTSTEPDDGYPPQLHAGKVGLGPEYGKGASGGDKLTGWKEEIAGKILHNPEKVQHGKDMRTGELKKREKEDEQNPFEPGSGPATDKGDAEKPDESKPPAVNSASRTDSNVAQAGTPQTGHEENTEKEQAATTAPEGSDEAEVQRKGEATHGDKQIG